MTNLFKKPLFGIVILFSSCQSSDPCTEKITSDYLQETLMTKANERKKTILLNCFKLDNTIRSNVKPTEEYYGRPPMKNGIYGEMIAFSTDDTFDTSINCRGSDCILYSTTNKALHFKLNNAIKDNFKEIKGGNINGHSTTSYYNPQKITAFGFYSELTSDGDTIYNIRLQKIILPN